MTTTLRAKFDGKVLVPEGEVDLPLTQTLILSYQPERAGGADAEGALWQLAEKLGSYPAAELPSDFSSQHDHYLYGTPKRDDA